MTAQLMHEGTQGHTSQPAGQAGRGRVAAACRRIGQVVGEMNYASRRLVELQAPWSVDKQWHRK
jgi:hypothetical protein